MKTQLAMVIDSSVCIDCKGCMLACKVENSVPNGHFRNWVKVSEPDFSDPDWMEKKAVSHFQPGGCMHCENPTCVDACPTGATYRDEADGTIRVNDSLCIGCASCVPACPYGARYRHPEKRVVDKCDFCAERRENGELPTCVTTCPTKARRFGNIRDPESEVAALLRGAAAIRLTASRTDTKPNMYYLTETAPGDWPVEPAPPAPITLWKRFAKPLVWAMTGFNAFVVLAMLGRQLASGEPGQADRTKPEKEDNHG